MTTSDAIKKCMKDKGITQAELAEQLGTKQTNISMYLRSNMVMQVSNLLRMANACGYEVVLVNRKDTGKAYVIGDADEIQVQASNDEDDFDARVRRIVAEELAKATPATSA